MNSRDMRLIHSSQDLQNQCEAWRMQGLSVAVVPTMGALHRGHLALIERATSLADRVVVTIFVNPLQFAPGEDLDKYPRTFADDNRLCEDAGVAAIFFPEPSEMYPEGDATRVNVTGLSEKFCGESRPEHFVGVATVVTKLLCLIGRSKAIFGAKDYQQLQIIRRLTLDLFLPVEIIAHPIVREADGLALSSRNRYLSADERLRALNISKGLIWAQQKWRDGASNSEDIIGPLSEKFSSVGLRIDYLDIANRNTLKPVEKIDENSVILLAVFCGTTRLIDNCELAEPIILTKSEI